MRVRHLTRSCLCALAVLTTIVATRVAAEPVQATPTVDANTVGLWRFQEGQGDRVAGEAGAPAGKLHGATWVPGRKGFAVATDSGYVSIDDSPALRPEKALTVEVWIKLVQSGGDLICKNSVYMLRLGGTIDGKVYIDGKWRDVHGRHQLPTGRWTHLAMTYDSDTKTVTLYIDGVLDAQQKIAGLTTGLVNQGKAALRIGANDWSPTGSEVDGKVDSLRISNVARAFEPLSLPASETTAKPVAAPKGNLIPNGDFELGLLGWRLAGEGDANLLWAPDAKDPASGRLSLHTVPSTQVGVDLREKADQSALLSRPVPAQAGTHYTLSAQMRCDAPEQKATISAIAAGGGKFARADSSNSTANLGTEWKKVSSSFTLAKDWIAPSLCIRIDPPKKGQFWVDDVRLVAGDGESVPALQDKIGVGAKAERVGNLFFADRKEQATLEIVNSDEKPHRVTVRAAIVDWDGKQLPLKSVGTFDLPARGVEQAAFPIDTARRGTFRLGFELTCDDQTWRQGAEFKYAVIVPLKGVGNAEDSIFAMNTHMEREPNAHLARNLEVLSQCGVKWIRGWWGWGMCEKERGQFDWTEYDRQLASVEGAEMRLMPILLRYYSQYEQEWAGSVATGTIQRPPYKWEEWSNFVRKVVERYKGRVPAWEVWNEPTMSGAGFTPKMYAELLRATATPLREIDPKAKIIGFAGVELPFIKNTLALDTAPLMDAISEHSYAQIERPEANLPKQTEALRAIMTADGGEKPIWHSEQGVQSDGDGYIARSLSEADAAALYTRNTVILRSLGIAKYFWFSAQTSPTYGFAIFYENYIPRPRLAALDACASFLEGAAYRKSCQPGKNTHAYLFEGSTPVAVVWNMNLPASLTLSVPSDAVQAFDLMGTPVPLLGSTEGIVVQLPTERPVYLRAKAGQYALLEKALADAKVREEEPVAVSVRPSADGVEVTVTCQSPAAQDGIVEVLPTTGVAPTAQQFDSLAPGENRSFAFTLSNKAAAGQVRVRVGNRQMREVTAALSGK
jgi:polysaccharide biosynthesis protein PslG